MPAHFATETVDAATLYVSPTGNDTWSGRSPDPSPDGTDGPLASMNGIHWAVRKLKEGRHVTGRLTLCFRGGRYEMGQPIVFTPRDGNPLTLTSYPGEEVTISGGKRITGWSVQKHAGKTAWVVTLPDVAAGSWYFRELFVNGERRSRPCFPKQEHYWMKSVPGLDLSKGMIDQFIRGNDRFYADPSEVGPWRNVSDIDVLGDHYWIEERLPVESIDPRTGLVQCTRRSMFVLRDDLAGRYCRYRFENVAEALAEPGEWYLDRSTGTLTYLPLPGEDPAAAVVMAPRTSRLLVLRGKPGEPIRGVTIENLTVECADWEQPPAGAMEGFEDAGVLRRDEAYGAATQSACNLDGVIQMEYAEECALKNCTIRNVGLYGVVLGKGCRGVTVSGCRMHDLGAGGIRLNGGDALADRVDLNGGHVVADNEISSGGRVFLSAVGVLMMHTYGNVVAHNHIHDFYYTGVSCGWVWGYGANVSRDNHIEYNHIHDIGQGVLSDMGGIYTLGVQPGTVLRGNLIHDIVQRNYGGWCIYLDEGSSHILVEGNVCYRAGSQVFNQHYGRENVVRNNVFAFGEHTVVSTGRLEDHNSFTLTHNVLLASGKPIFSIASVRPTDRMGFRSECNVVWDVAGKACFTATMTRVPGKQPELKKWDNEAWKTAGNDLFSAVADPRFADPAKGDFAVKGDSPLARAGIVLFDVSKAGPRGRTGARG